MNDSDAMNLALAEAYTAGEQGEVPVGAVVVVDGKVVASAGNRREATRDPTAHAEITALREAARILGRWRMPDATVYVTLEPCPMCAGALVAARIGRLVFACADPKAGACGSLYNLCCDPRLNHEIEIDRGLEETRASSLLSEWFAARREKSARGAADTL